MKPECSEAECSEAKCERPAYARGLCDPCYQRHWKRGEVGRFARAIGEAPPDGLCSADGCSRRHYARKWCKGHYERWRRHRDVQPGVPLIRRGFGPAPVSRAHNNFDLTDTGEM